MKNNQLIQNFNSPKDLMDRCVRTPWESYVEPFPLAPKVWYVSGNDWVSAYLIDTNDGLILIDVAMHENVYLLLENIRLLGYKPTDVKKILISHAHIDHMGAAKSLKELTGAEIYLGKRDEEFLLSKWNLVGGTEENCYTIGKFTPDKFYSDDILISQGNICIKTISTPGHTPGCTSFIFDVKDKNGNIYTCGMHGGVGLNTMSKQYFEESKLPISLRDEFINSFNILKRYKVDICLPSHTNQVNILDKRDKITEDFNPYIDSSIWHDFLEKRLTQALELFEIDK